MAPSCLRVLSAIVLLAQIITAQTATAPQQIFALPAFSQQQLCVQGCFTSDVACVTDLVGSVIGCPINPCSLSSSQFGAPDNCYCRGDLQGAAQSFISSCVEASCTVGDTSANVATAVSMYAGYCTSLGFTAHAPASTTGETTSLDTNLGTSGTTNRAGGATNTSSALSDSSYPSKTTLYIALAAVGGCAALFFISSIIWAHKYRKLRQMRQNGYPGNSLYGTGYVPSMQPASSHNSSHPLRFDHELTPTDSASNLGVPAYTPHPHEPSLISTRMY